MNFNSQKESSICFLCGINQNDPKFNMGFSVCSPCMESQASNLKTMKDSRKKFYPEIDQISERLFLGNEDASQDLELLKRKGITHILVAGRYLERKFPEEFKYFSIEIDDSPFENITKYFSDCHKFISQAESCFVHCAAGVSRSASIVISYLMMDRKISFKEAREFVKKKRRCIFPNSGFVQQLQDYEKTLGLEEK